MSLSTGAILRGKYRLEAPIGKGGMGEVFEATQLATGALVAIKVVSRAFADDLLMARMHREAEAARRIQSEYVPKLYDVDSTADGELFLVMERLRGETLSERLKRRGGFLSWDEVRRLGDDVLHGLIDAHAAGVVHRDLKPGNIFLEQLPDGAERARVLDFGVCKLDAHDGDSLTHTGEAVGTISYMAPEQIRGAAKVDARADVYAFAMVVFEALSGRLAHDASGQIAMIASKLERPARNLRDCARVAVPAGVDALLAKCLSQSPHERPSSAADLLRVWRALGGRQMVVPTPMPIVVRSEIAYPTETGLTAAPPSRVTQKSTMLGVIVAAAALVASSIVLVIALRSRTTPANAAELPPAAATTDTPATASAPAPAPAPSPAPASADPSFDVEFLPVASAPDAPDASVAKPKKKPSAPRAPVAKGNTAPSQPQISTQPRY